jgi:hypothetical protein
MLNPWAIRGVLRHLHIAHLFFSGFDYWVSIAGGFAAVVAGIVAVVRIRKSNGMLRGIPFAVLGLIAGALWVGIWAVYWARYCLIMMNW